jgi:hypothetical protein
MVSLVIKVLIHPKNKIEENLAIKQYTPNDPN